MRTDNSLPSPTRTTRTPMLVTLLAGALASTAALAGAQDVEQNTPTDTPATVPQGEPVAVGSAVSVQFNFDVTTAYFYRGIIQEDTGPIFQPAAKLTLNLHEADGVKLDGFFSTWHSLHGQKTGSSTRGDVTEYWYEADIAAGLSLTRGPWSLSASYTALTSPSDAFETVQELGLSVGLDDSQWLGAWSLKPAATLAIEVGADASDGADSDPGVYLELGVSPGLTTDLSEVPVTVTFPASIGLSVKDYYQNAEGDDDTLGFVQVGAEAALPLGEGRFGAWTLSAGVSLLLLGDHTSEYNAGDDAELIATVGLQWNF